MLLPLVRARNGGGSALPDAEAITKCMTLSTTPEAAEYLKNSANELYTKAGLSNDESINDVLEILSAHEDYIKLSADDRNIWKGALPVTVFEKRQDDLAAQASKIIGEKANNVRLDFAISDDSQILRGYSSNGEALAKPDIDAMDKLFNAWLAENNMISKSGTIYKGTKSGEIQKDANGEMVKADPQDLKATIDGFERYVQRTNKSAQITIEEQPYPSAQAAEAVGPS